METDVIDCKMVQHVIKSEIRNGHVMHVIYVIFFITCVTHSYFALHASSYTQLHGMFRVPRTIYTVPTRVLASKEESMTLYLPVA
jgi:hypothetical protein